MKLHDIQSRFTETLLQEDGGQNSRFNDLFKTGTVTTNDRLSVYRNNLFKSLTGVLTATYPATEKLVGENFMRGMARAYIKDHLPRSACLSDYGADFPAFVSGYAPAAKLDYLPYVAQLEWGLHSAACAPDDCPLDPGLLKKLSPITLANTRFSLRASCRLVNAPYPVDEIHAFALSGDSLQPPDITSGPVWLLVTRTTFETGLFRLEPDEYTFLQALSAGKTLQTASEKHLAPNCDARLAAILERHFRKKIFLAFF